ncbi:MAG: hypothetical protein KKG33_10360 [candidate division Zixibacteria bacterium]|nr:hypothetical protein [candidate division Zixibacteria bacterium]MBU1470189.1 hypothetical protein [candidate division Zixibacteria bacterium]MBU2625950.1 hypothetical protein [candidate division Zixibacteria bacterium]
MNYEMDSFSFSIPEEFDILKESSDYLELPSAETSKAIRANLRSKLLLLGLALLGALFISSSKRVPFLSDTTTLVRSFFSQAHNVAEMVLLVASILTWICALVFFIFAFRAVLMLVNPPKASVTSILSLEYFFRGAMSEFGNQPRAWCCMTQFAKNKFNCYRDFIDQWRMFMANKSTNIINQKEHTEPYSIESIRELKSNDEFSIVEATMTNKSSQWIEVRTLVKIGHCWYLIDGEPHYS